MPLLLSRKPWKGRHRRTTPLRPLEMNKEEEELIHELHYWEEQRKKERAQIKAIENGEMEPGRFIANMAMDAADCIGFSRHKNQVSHGEDVLKNDLTITFNRSLVR